VKRMTWATGAAVSAIALAAPLLLAAPASAAGCTYANPAPVLNTPNPTSPQAWTNMTLTGTSPAVCGSLQVQRQIGTGAWTTITGIKPQPVSTSNTFNFFVQLGVTGQQRIRVFYTNQDVPVFSNYKTITVKSDPTPPPDQCADDATPPVFLSIPNAVVAGQKFQVQATSPEVCGQVTLLRKDSGGWRQVGVDTPGPKNLVFYTVSQKVSSSKTKTKKAYMLTFTDQGDGDVVDSEVRKVIAYKS
jgi:hypothetical protein